MRHLAKLLVAVCVLVAALALPACKSDTAFGLKVDAGPLGTFELHGDPVKCVGDEVKGVTDGVGLTSPASAPAAAPPAK